MSHPHPELSLPPPLPAGGVRLVALGGLGEVGRNMTVIEHAGKLLIVDCGVLFPDDHQPGVDLILPDFEYIEERMADIEAVVLTHGHEDHIGALPYLLRMRDDIPPVSYTHLDVYKRQIGRYVAVHTAIGALIAGCGS